MRKGGGLRWVEKSHCSLLSSCSLSDRTKGNSATNEDIHRLREIARGRERMWGGD